MTDDLEVQLLRILAAADQDLIVAELATHVEAVKAAVRKAVERLENAGEIAFFRRGKP